MQVRGLQFNTLNSPHLLASGGADSEINIWTLTDLRHASSHPASRVRFSSEMHSLQQC